MAVATSRLTKKYQATIPETIRERLMLAAGDMIAFEFDAKQEGVALVRKARPADMEFAQALDKTLSEWNSPYDEEAYGDL